MARSTPKPAVVQLLDLCPPVPGLVLDIADFSQHRRATPRPPRDSFRGDPELTCDIDTCHQVFNVVHVASSFASERRVTFGTHAALLRPTIGTCRSTKQES